MKKIQQKISVAKKKMGKHTDIRSYRVCLGPTYLLLRNGEFDNEYIFRVSKYTRLLKSNFLIATFKFAYLNNFCYDHDRYSLLLPSLTGYIWHQQEGSRVEFQQFQTILFCVS